MDFVRLNHCGRTTLTLVAFSKLLLHAWATSPDPNRPKETLRCLIWMEEESKRNKAIVVDQMSIATVILSCNLLGTSPKEQHIEQAFYIAKEKFEKLVKEGPTYHPTFAWYLQTCALLDDQDLRRYEEAERCFRLCKISGLVSSLVWSVLHEKFPASFAERISEGTIQYTVPNSWRRNVRKASADGKPKR